MQDEFCRDSDTIGSENGETLNLFKNKLGERNGEDIYQLSLEIIDVLKCSTRAIIYKELEEYYRNRYRRKLDPKKAKFALLNKKIKVITIEDLKRKEKAKKLRYLSGLRGSTRIFYLSNDQLEKLISM